MNETLPEETPLLVPETNQQELQDEIAAQGITPVPVSENHVIIDDIVGPLERDLQVNKDTAEINQIWGEDTTVNQVAQKSDQDMLDYLHTRDYMDSEGTVIDARTNLPKTEQEANEPVVDTQNDTPLNELPLNDSGGLIDKWAEAELHEDKTTSLDIEEEIVRRLDTIGSGAENVDQNSIEDHKTELYERLHNQMLERKAAISGEAPVVENEDASVAEKPTELNSEDSPEDSKSNQIKQQIDELESQLAELREQLVVSETPSNTPEKNDTANPEVTENAGKDEVEPATTEETDKYTDLPEVRRAQKANLYQAAVLMYAQAKIGAEKMLAGKDQREALEVAGQELKTAYNEFLAADSEVRDISLDAEPSVNQQSLEDITARLEATRQERDSLSQDELNADRVTELNQQIQDLENEQKQAQEIADAAPDTEAEKQALKIQSLIELSKNVEDTMLAERTKAHPKLAKINNWLKNHPKTRLAVGLGFTTMGLVGAATFNAPLVSLSIAGGATMRAYGAYNASRGVGDWLANRKLAKADLEDIDTYLNLSGRQARTRQISKQVGAAAAVVLSATPLLARLAEGHGILSSTQNHPNQSLGRASTPPPQSPVIAPTTHSLPPIRPIEGNMLPWTYGMQELHTNISDPSVLSRLTNNPFGIRFTGNGLSGGQGSIVNVEIPGQGTFSDIGHINSAIAYVLGNTAN